MLIFQTSDNCHTEFDYDYVYITKCSLNFTILIGVYINPKSKTISAFPPFIESFNCVALNLLTSIDMKCC